MATAVFLDWPGLTPEQYDQLREVVGWERDKPEGGVLHAATFYSDGARIFDVWDSEEAFQNFVQERIMPGVQQVGLQAEPSVQTYPVHALFTPGL